MSERKYSFSEIESMRSALAMSYPTAISYNASERSKEVEERVRTLMIGGVDPSEVIDKCSQVVSLRALRI